VNYFTHGLRLSLTPNRKRFTPPDQNQKRQQEARTTR